MGDIICVIGTLQFEMHLFTWLRISQKTQWAAPLCCYLRHQPLSRFPKFLSVKDYFPAKKIAYLLKIKT